MITSIPECETVAGCEMDQNGPNSALGTPPVCGTSQCEAPPSDGDLKENPSRDWDLDLRIS